MPYTNFSAWRSAQQSDSSMRRAYAHLLAGTRPSKKATNAKDLKSIIRLASIDEIKGILIVRKQDPYVGNRDLIFCPSDLVHGLVLALHIFFTHPSKYQMEKLFARNFYALNSAKVIEAVTNSCEVCNSLKAIPREMFDESSSPSADTPGQQLAADVICRKKQKILIVRDCLTSFTSATFINDESAAEYKKALVLCCLPLKFGQSTIRVDCAPALRNLSKDLTLHQHGLVLDLGNPKNVNKNPVAEKANQELEKELLKVDPSGNPVSAVTLLQAVCVLNSRIRSCGLSSREMFLGRDQITGKILNLSDKHLSDNQEANRSSNHGYSAKCKARGGPLAKSPSLPVGSLVYIKDEGDKFNTREPYIIVGTQDKNVLLQKSASSGLLSSRQYLVPSNKVFPMIPLKKAKQKDVTGPATCSDSSDSDDYTTHEISNQDTTVEEIPQSSVPTQETEPVHRPSRTRSKPQRYGIDPDNNSHSGDSESDDLIQSWYPGWSKSRTRNYIAENNGS